MLSGIFGSENFSNLLQIAMLSAEWTECDVAM